MPLLVSCHSQLLAASGSGRQHGQSRGGETRIFFSKIDGICAANDFSAASEVGFSSDVNRVDILCMAETNPTGVTKILDTPAMNTSVQIRQIVNSSQRHPLSHSNPHTNLAG
jgi:hypothetical protein